MLPRPQLLGAIFLWSLCCSSLALATVRDVRKAFQQESRDNFKKRAAQGQRSPPKHLWQNPSGTGHFYQKTLPDPGGTGYGYYFYDSALLWAESTSIDYYIISPSTLGGTSTDWLYLTTTCRAQLGVEALVGYFQENEAQFMVFDWARPPNDRWQIGINLPTSHPEYLHKVPDEFGNPRQMCHVRNSTRTISASGSTRLWENDVLLFNFILGDWDLVYSYLYSTDSPNSNLFSPGGGGWWGPIVETFGSYNQINAIGFDSVRLFQDDKTNVLWLTTANSYLQNAPEFHPITVAANRSFAVYSGASNLESYPFPITALSRDNVTSTVTLQVSSFLARDFQAYTGVLLGGHLTWLAAGSPIHGSGESISIAVPAPLESGIYKVGWKYNSGTLCVVANDPAATFALTPSSGALMTPWISQPLTNKWDKIIVGLRPGNYTITFDPLPGRTAPSPQSFVLVSNGVTTVQASFTP